MRDLIDLIQLLEGDGATEGSDGVKAKGLYPDELKKRDNFDTFISKINKGLPFIYHPTGEEVYIKRSEANKIKQLFDNGQLIGKKITVMTIDGNQINQINLGELRKTEEFGGSSKENLKLKPSSIGITDRDIPATDLYEQIKKNSVLQSTDYGQVVINLADYIISDEYVQLPPEMLEKDKESVRKAIVDYAGEYLGVLALLYGRTRFPRRNQFIEWLGGDLGDLVLNFPSKANNNIADSYATITNPNTSHSLNISSKGTGGGAAPAISGLKLGDDIKRNPKLKDAVKLIELCQEKSTSGPSTIVQAFKVADLVYLNKPDSFPKEFQQIMPTSSKAPKLMDQCIESINSGMMLPKLYQPLINDIASEKATDGGKMVYKLKKIVAHAINEGGAIPEFRDTILQVLEMNFIQQYTDYNPNGELTFATQWPSKLEGVVTLENKSSAIEPSSAGFSFKLGRNASDYEDPSPDGEVGASTIGADDDVKQMAQDIVEPRVVKKQKGDDEIGVGREKRPKIR
jgi:hypothetical protein